MKIDNIRIGFATNSSSSHSMLLLKDSLENVNKHMIFPIEEECDCYNGFEWDNFILVSYRSKLKYLASQLSYNLSRLNWQNKGSYPDVTKSVKELFLEFLDVEIDPGIATIDHESVMYIPVDFKTNKISLPFFFDFCKALLRNGIVLGGNDNYPKENNIEGELQDLNLLKNYSFNGKIIKQGDWYTHMNNYGNKVRFSFEESPKEFTGAITPELLDVKITNYCEHNCSYCYQNSTNVRVEPVVTYTELGEVINELAPFEAVLGGGELLQNKEDVLYFENLCKVIDSNIHISITLNDPLLYNKLSDTAQGRVTSVGISFDGTYKDYQKKQKQLETLPNLYMRDTVMHVVMGTIAEEELQEILFNAQRESRLLLLGFKEVGRGSNYPKKDYSWLPEVLKSNSHLFGRIAVDTKLAQEFEQEFIDMGITKTSFFTQEGFVSAYLDAVTSKVGISSYDPLEDNTEATGDTVTNLVQSVKDVMRKAQALPEIGE